jgi:formylglycine-generating enzyme required for sulfatase activity
MKLVLIFLVLSILLLVSCTPSDVSTTPSPRINTGIDSDSWVLIPAGEFLMGLHDHETDLDYNYEIMVTDVTKAKYAEYLNAALSSASVKIVADRIVGYYPGDEFRGYEHEEEIEAGDWLYIPLDDPGLRLNFDGESFSSMPGYENHPMTLVTWFGAKAYCEFYNWRLPTEEEWEKAARGEDARPFPWGDGIEPNRANYYSSHDIFEKIVGGLGDTTPVGFYNGQSYEGFSTLDSPSPYGLYDMAGNVWQWTGNVYDNQHYRYMRGGSKDNYAYNLRVWTRNSAGPNYYSPGVGFRCVRDLEVQ